MAEQLVHPPVAVQPTGRTEHEVAEVPPTLCDAGHPLRSPVLVGWYPCTCGGHRTYRCDCGTTVHCHGKPAPRPRCLPARRSELGLRDTGPTR
jgi:hypothetical protein